MAVLACKRHTDGLTSRWIGFGGAGGNICPLTCQFGASKPNKRGRRRMERRRRLVRQSETDDNVLSSLRGQIEGRPLAFV